MILNEVYDEILMRLNNYGIFAESSNEFKSGKNKYEKFIYIDKINNIPIKLETYSDENDKKIKINKIKSYLNKYKHDFLVIKNNMGKIFKKSNDTIDEFLNDGWSNNPEEDKKRIKLENCEFAYFGDNKPSSFVFYFGGDNTLGGHTIIMEIAVIKNNIKFAYITFEG